MAKDVIVRFAGAAGQGVQTSSSVLGKAAARSGLFAFSHTDVESRIRGGLNFTQLRISRESRQAIRERVDILVAQTAEALTAYGDLVPEDGIVLVQDDWEHERRAPFTLKELAREAGADLAAGTVASAAVAKLIGLKDEVTVTVLHDLFGSDEKIKETNRRAAELSWKAVEKWGVGDRFRFELPGDKGERVYLSGGEAIALGAVAGGVGFMTAYPMSPSTSIITNLAQWAERTGLIVEQAEDEIAAINMVAGAAYAGARAMTTTSGGGFDLMSEGVSLIGMAELPAVIVIGQRPGPSTNQATRTQQNDLRLVLHAGHGHFARVVLAPKDVADGVEITARAFDIAERYQVPVFILTDQQLQDGQTTADSFDVSSLPADRHLLDGEALRKMEAYRRFALTDSGVSPMAAPGASEHLVIFTSDEHSEGGHITEDREEVRAMVEKRLRKVATVASELPAELKVEGEIEDAPLAISWGSSYHTVAEALELLARDGVRIAHLHLRQMWPLDGPAIAEIYDRAAQVVIVENNLDGQLADLLQQAAVRSFDRRIRRIDGRPFTVEELVERIGKEIQR
jgi:2-oxoglutarate ferredoxin oxidoreductase subunit alpha